MIHIHVTYKVKPGMRDEFLNAVMQSGVPEKTRREDGNSRYDYFLPVGIDDEVFLVELWRDSAALKAHAASAHMQELKPIKEKYVLNTDIQRIHEAPKPEA